MPPTCHFCTGDHPLDAAGAAQCQPKRRFRGALTAALAAPPGRRTEALFARVVFLGERPSPDFVEALLARLEREGWPT